MGPDVVSWNAGEAVMNRRDVPFFCVSSEKRYVSAEHGHTLIELMVVVAVIGIILGVSAMSAVSVSRHSKFNRASLMLVNDLELLQSRAESSKHRTRIVRETNGYRCYDDDALSSTLNVVRTFPAGVAWSPESEFAPDGAEIRFARSATPYIDSVTLLTLAKDELVLHIPDELKKTITISPVVGRIEMK